MSERIERRELRKERMKEFLTYLWRKKRRVSGLIKIKAQTII